MPALHAGTRLAPPHTPPHLSFPPTPLYQSRRRFVLFFVTMKRQIMVRGYAANCCHLCMKASGLDTRSSAHSVRCRPFHLLPCLQHMIKYRYVPFSFGKKVRCNPACCLALMPARLAALGSGWVQRCEQPAQLSPAMRAAPVVQLVLPGQ